MFEQGAASFNTLHLQSLLGPWDCRIGANDHVETQLHVFFLIRVLSFIIAYGTREEGASSTALSCSMKSRSTNFQSE